MVNSRVLDPEKEREILVRTVSCPVCGANPKAPCRWPRDTYPATSHTGRYDRAASVGLVPPLPGTRAQPRLEPESAEPRLSGRGQDG